MSEMMCPNCGVELEWALQPKRHLPPPVVVQPACEDKDDPRLTITVAETAKRLGVGRQSVYHELNSGRLRSVRIGRRRLVPVVELQQFLANLAEDAAPAAPFFSSSSVAAPAWRPRRAPSAPRRTKPERAPSTPSVGTPWIARMSQDEHEVALKNLAARGWPDDVIEHMRAEAVGPYVLSLPEAAKRLGVSKSTAYKMAHEGRLPAFTPEPAYRDQKPKLLVGVRALRRWIDRIGSAG